MDINAQERETRQQISELLATQKLAVLSTQRNGQPYSSLMAFACAGDLDTILVATGSATRKHANLTSEPRVSLLFDNRSNETSDFHQASALTALGKAVAIGESDLRRFQTIYLEKHPYLETFITAPSSVFFKITIYHYLLVNRFQQVLELHLTDAMDLFSQA